MSMTVSEVIRTKRSVRQYTDEPLSEEAIRPILNAGRRAQSSKNTQPWHFIGIRGRAILWQLAECDAYARHLAEAPFAVALVASTAYSFDLGQAQLLCNWSPETWASAYVSPLKHNECGYFQVFFQMIREEFSRWISV